MFKENDLSKRIVQFLLICWCIFAIYMFNKNQFFFLFTGVIATITMLLITHKRISIFKDSIEVTNCRWFSFLNKSTYYSFSDIEKIEFIDNSPSVKDQTLELIVGYIVGFYGNYSSRYKFINIQLQNNKRIEIKIVMQKTKFKELSTKLTEQFNNFKK